MENFLTWCQDSWLGVAMRDIAWLWPISEALHFIGLCVMFGALLVVDLRVLGMARGIPLGSAMKFIPIAIGGFALNLLTGIAFFAGDPFRYWPNISFRIKIILILLAGINAIAFEVLERRRLEAAAPDADVEGQGKLIAGLSLGLWVGVIVMGRMIPYLGTG
jgi:hypothetical protein